MRLLTSIVVLVLVGAAGAASQFLDRVVARVGGDIITWSDVEAAQGLGLISVQPGAEPTQAAIGAMIDRRLILNEVARFPPDDPSEASIAAQAALLRQHAGPDLPRLMRVTGLDDARIEAHARDDLRIQAYLDQRFGLTMQVSDDEVRKYYEANPHEFVRDGTPAAFEQVEGLARQRAAAQRRETIVAQWLRDLRARTEIVVVPSGKL